MITFLFILGLVVQSAIAFSSIRRNVKIGSHLDTKLKLKSSTTLNDIPTQYRVDNTQLKSTTLNDIPTKSTQQPIEKVAIIGAGISGLSLAHALRSTNLMNDDVNATPIQIDIFDSRQDLDEKSGSGMSLLLHTSYVLSIHIELISYSVHLMQFTRDTINGRYCRFT